MNPRLRPFGYFLQAAKIAPDWMTLIPSTILALAGIVGAVLFFLKMAEAVGKHSDNWRVVRLAQINSQAVGIEAVERYAEESKNLTKEVQKLTRTVEEFRQKQEDAFRERLNEMEDDNGKKFRDIEDSLFKRIEQMMQIYAAQAKKF